MKHYAFCLCLLLFTVPLLGMDGQTELNLLDGSKLKAKVMSSNGSEVTVMSDFGILRIALEKLTPESRQIITQATKPDVDALLKRVAELEAKLAQVQQENESLRKQALSRPTVPPAGIQSLTPTNTPSTGTSSGLQYSISSTGKRHNSNCRYFGSGRLSGPNEGIACKICGG